MTVHVGVEGMVGTLVVDAPPLNLLSDAVRAALREALDDFARRRVAPSSSRAADAPSARAPISATRPS